MKHWFFTAVITVSSVFWDETTFYRRGELPLARTAYTYFFTVYSLDKVHVVA
jgi:hypothetical protein